MATPKSPNRQNTPQERSEQLRQQLAAREALQTLDTFEAADSEPASRVEDAPLVEASIESNAAGFGQTDVTEVTGDATFDEDLADQAGNVGNDELAGGQATIDEYNSARAAAIAALAPEEEEGGQKPPTFQNRLGGSGAEAATGGGGGDDAMVSGTGGGGAGDSTNSNIVGGHGRPAGLGTGADFVSTAGGPQSDMSYLVGDPRGLVRPGGGNSAANDSDAYHNALGAVLHEQATATTDKYSVAQDGGALSNAIAGANAAHPEGAAAGTAGSASTPAAAPAATPPPDDDSGGVVAGVIAGALAAPFVGVVGAVAVGLAVAGGDDDDGKPLMGEFKMDASSGGLPSRDFSGIEGFGNPGTTTQAQAGKAVGVSNLETAMSNSLGSKGGGVKDPGPDDDRRDGPPSEAEIALRLATNKLLGRNDALVHGPATQIDPGEQGEVFQKGTGEVIDVRKKVGLDGDPPRDPDQRPAAESDLNQAAPSLGPDGTEVLVEDGNPFTGGQRNDEDPQFGRVEPLIGLEGGNGTTDDDDALPPEDDEDEETGGKRSRLSVFDDDDA